MKTIRYFYCTFFLYLIANTDVAPADNIKYLENGGCIYRIDARSMFIASYFSHLAVFENEWLVYERKLASPSACIFLTEKIQVSHNDGQIIVIPEFKSQWFGTIDPTNPDDKVTARLDLIFNDRHTTMNIKNSFFEKTWWGRTRTEKDFYIGELEQEYSDPGSDFKKNRATLSLIENINENDEFHICVSHISPGTEFRLRSITVITYPFVKER